jgi:hypothetical protein
MYDQARTWNPFVGCLFDCVYCRYSFQLQAKRQKQRCSLCAEYEPHFHPERLKRIPPAHIVFVCGYSDVRFALENSMHEIIKAVKQLGKPGQTFYFQSKAPACFEPFLKDFSDNVILLTTIETNRDTGYQALSKAPAPSIRYDQFRSLDYPRKVLTLEPLLKFDHDVMVEMVREIKPEYVWLGVNSKRRFKALKCLPEPSADEFWKLHDALSQFVDVKIKTEPVT